MFPRPCLVNTDLTASRKFHNFEQVKDLANRVEEVLRYVQWTHIGSIVTMVSLSVIWISLIAKSE